MSLKALPVKMQQSKNPQGGGGGAQCAPLPPSPGAVRVKLNSNEIVCILKCKLGKSD